MTRIIYTCRTSQAEQRDRPSLLVRIAAGLITAMVLVVSAFLGLVIFLAALGIFAVVGAVIAIRLWLFKRRVETALKWGAKQYPRERGYIDAEYKER